MNRIKKIFMYSTFILLPICVNAADSLEWTANFADLHKANKGVVNNALSDVYDKRGTFYNELNFDSLFNGKELKLLSTNYITTLSNEISDNASFVSELGLGYRRLPSKHNEKTINFDIADITLKMYLSYDINESKSIKNAINIGVLGHDAIMFKNKDKFSFNEIDTASFVQYYFGAKFGIFKTENSATIAYNYNFIRNMKDGTGILLLDKHYSENYFDALLKTKTGLEFDTNILNFKTSFVVSYNTRLNKKRDNLTVALKDNSTNLSCEYKDRLNVGLEGEIIANIVGIKLNADYDVIGKSFYYGLNANVKF